MDLSNPFSYVRQECTSLDISLSRLCRRADVPRRTFYDWEAKPPSSIQTLARLEEALRRERVANGRDALDRAAILLNSLRDDPATQWTVLCRFDDLMKELEKLYGLR